MTPEQFDELQQIRQQNNDLDPVFVPYVGVNWGHGDAPSVMICGKATNDWEEGDTFDVQGQHAVDFVNFVANPDVHVSTFWTFCWEIIHACLYRNVHLPDFGIHLDNEHPPATLVNNFCWNNLAKFGFNGGNLPINLLNQHAGLFAEILTGEIAQYNPDVVVFTTGDFGFNLIENFAGEGDWNHPVEEQFEYIQPQNLWYCYSENLAATPTHLIWTRHPQGWSRAARRESAEYIGGRL